MSESRLKNEIQCRQLAKNNWDLTPIYDPNLLLLCKLPGNSPLLQGPKQNCPKASPSLAMAPAWMTSSGCGRSYPHPGGPSGLALPC
jgi:hypothetical protein